MPATKQPVRRPPRRIWRSLGFGAVALIALNILLGVVYHNRTYPRTSMGTAAVGNSSFDRVKKLARGEIYTSQLMLQRGSQTLKVPIGQLGVHENTSRTQASLAAARSWLPLVAIFTKHTVAVPAVIDTQQLSAWLDQPGAVLRKAPVNAKVVLSGEKFSTIAPQNGYVPDRQKLQQAILTALDQGKTTLNVPEQTWAPAKNAAWASRTAKSLQQSLGTPLTYSFNGASRKLTANDILSWYKPADDSYALDDLAVRMSIAHAGVAIGVHAGNLSDAVLRTKQAVAKNTAVTIALQPFAATKTYTYCVASRGATAAAYLPALKAKLTSTYEDLRGWSLDGQVIFRYADSGCDFTVWAADAAEMPSFDPVCDTYWNCEVQGNVVVNIDRWQSTTPSWRAAGGTDEDYRVLLINHETGHMLGFQHWSCPAAGQPAPVMMQQSIDLGGCNFNIWPTPAELNTLRSTLGL